MPSVADHDHNDMISLSVKVCDLSKRSSQTRAYKLTVTTNDAEQVPFIIWKQSPAAGLDWTVGEWYRIDEALVKQWSETTELNATNRTTAERIPSETVEASIVDSEAVNQSSMAGRCGFTWIPEEQNNTDSCAYCCYRSTWKEFDRCVWHAKTDLRKPSDTLVETREQPENRKLNGSPRELLSGAVLRDAELTDSVLTGVDFSGSDFRNTNLNDVYLSYSNLSEADFRGADLTDCTVSKVSFRNANLRNADLRGLSIFGIDFTDAELSEADFREANIKNTDLTGANPEAAKGLVDTEKPGGDETTGEVSRQNQSDLSGETHSGKGVSLVHTTNTYLDRKNMGRKERQNDFVSAFKQVVDYACASEAEALIHSGNLFWSKNPDAWVVKECRRLLKKLKNNQVEFILVRGERDVTRTQDIIQELENKGLLSGPQTGWYQVSDIGIFLYGKGSPPLFEDEHTPPTDATSYLAVLFDDVSTATNGSLPTLEKTLGTSLDAVLIGNRSEPTHRSESGIQVLSPGMPEQIVGKKHIEVQPRSPIFFEYQVTGDAVDVTTHEVDARPVSGFQINLDPDATVREVESALAKKDLHNAAVIVELVGAKTEDSISKNEVQQLISDQSAIVRVYDERSRVENQEMSSSDSASTSPEWDVDSLAAATTLDPEDVEDAVNRLVDAGRSHDEAIGYVRRYLKEMLQGDGLFAVYGVGPSSGSSLVDASITSIEELRTVTPQDLSNRTDLSTEQLQRLQEAAQAGNFSSLEPDDEQVAKQLLDSPKDPHTQNTESKQSPDTKKRTDRDADQSEDSKVDSTPEFQDNSKEATSPDGNSQQEVLTPGELPVPAPEEYTVPGGGTVYPNYLSEYYESFRNARKVLELVFQISGTDIDPEDRRDPRVQYFVLLDACIGFGDVSTPFTGYGPQHQDRLSFSIRDYRKVFGNAETVTDYQVIDVKPFRDDTHELLREMASVKTTREFVRPCIPGTNHPIPELPGSFEELQDALLRLATFPAYPPLPSENGNNNRTIPIAEMYRTCFEDLDKEHQVDVAPLEATGSQPTGPVPAATPTSPTEAESKLIDYGRLSHLFRRATPPAGSPVNRALNVFALDWYRPDSRSFNALQALAKHGEDDPIDTFRPRLQDLLHRRFLLDTWEYDYITVYPGHEAGSRSSQLVELAQDAVLETDIIYTPLLERTETVERQREKSEEERRQVAFHPSESLRTRAKLHNDTVILFDDICTTGSSLLAGAHLLRQAGADRVVCITLGLTPGGPWTDVKEITDPETPASEIIAGVD